MLLSLQNYLQYSKSLAQREDGQWWFETRAVWSLYCVVSLDNKLYTTLSLSKVVSFVMDKHPNPSYFLHLFPTRYIFFFVYFDTSLLIDLNIPFSLCFVVFLSVNKLWTKWLLIATTEWSLKQHLTSLFSVGRCATTTGTSAGRAGKSIMALLETH